MKKFIVIYRAPQSAIEAMENSSPDEMKKGMEPWMEWAKKCGDALVDLGTPLGNGMKITKEGAMSSESDVSGYSVLQAENIEEATKLLLGHPHVMWAEGCSVEVFESLALPGM